MVRKRTQVRFPMCAEYLSAFGRPLRAHTHRRYPKHAHFKRAHARQTVSSPLHATSRHTAPHHFSIRHTKPHHTTPHHKILFIASRRVEFDSTRVVRILPEWTTAVLPDAVFGIRCTCGLRRHNELAPQQCDAARRDVMGCDGIQ